MASVQELIAAAQAQQPISGAASALENFLGALNQSGFQQAPERGANLSMRLAQIRQLQEQTRQSQEESERQRMAEKERQSNLRRIRKGVQEGRLSESIRVGPKGVTVIGETIDPIEFKREKPPTGFRWTATGELEKIPGGPAKTTDKEKKLAAQSRVSGNLETMAHLYNKLSEMGGIVDVEKSTIQNIPARIGSSRLGQLAGGAIGTQTQSIRNQINQIRPLLIQEIRQATEMGARGLDSEKELEFYLQAATDPARDIQSNLASINVLDKAYGLGVSIKGVDSKSQRELRNEFESIPEDSPFSNLSDSDLERRINLLRGGGR